MGWKGRLGERIIYRQKKENFWIRISSQTCRMLHALRAGRGAHCPSVFVCVAHLSLEMSLYVFTDLSDARDTGAATSLPPSNWNSSWCFHFPLTGRDTLGAVLHTWLRQLSTLISLAQARTKSFPLVCRVPTHS